MLTKNRKRIIFIFFSLSLLLFSSAHANKMISVNKWSVVSVDKLSLYVESDNTNATIRFFYPKKIVRKTMGLREHIIKCPIAKDSEMYWKKAENLTTLFAEHLNNQISITNEDIIEMASESGMENCAVFDQ